MKLGSAPLLALTLTALACGPVPEEALETSFDDVVRSGGIQGFGRTVILPGVADPDAYVDGNNVYVTGTFDARVLPIWKLDGGRFVETKRYDPSRMDPNFDYCGVWAPDLTKLGETWILAFTAARVPVGTRCDQLGNAGQMIVYATAPDANLNFGAPMTIALGPDAPWSKPTRGCPAEGCDRALRIDISVFQDTDGQTYLSYTWFSNGNHNATVSLSDPTRIIRNTDPSQADEQGINEAPEIFKRGDIYYFLYSTGDFRGDYRLRYIMANSVQELTKARGVHELTAPVYRDSGKKYETAGHGTIIEFAGKYYIVYHVGEMNEAGELIGRDTVVSPVAFKSDGTMRMLNALDVSWTNLGNRDYSLDVRTNGRWIGPCVHAGHLGRRTSVQLTDLCPAGDQLAPLETVDAVRICHAAGGDWSQARCSEANFNRDRDTLFVPLSL